jgi:hypothetical protein
MFFRELKLAGSLNIFGMCYAFILLWGFSYSNTLTQTNDKQHEKCHTKAAVAISLIKT